MKSKWVLPIAVVLSFMGLAPACSTKGTDTTKPKPSGTTSNTTGASNGAANGATAGTTNGATAGTTNGATAGTTNGATAGTTNGATAGTTNGATAGTTNGATAGTTNGATAGNTNGATNGTTTGACVPYDETCDATTPCCAGLTCDLDYEYCRVSTGGTCNPNDDGLECYTGYCAEGSSTCALAPLHSDCSFDNQCASGHCDPDNYFCVAPGTTTGTTTGGACGTLYDDCENKACCTGMVCDKGMGECRIATGIACDPAEGEFSCYSYYCSASSLCALAPDGSYCDYDDQCATGVCDPDSYMCGSGGTTTGTTTGGGCSDIGFDCGTTADCCGGLTCDTAWNACYITNGLACTDDNDCYSYHCNPSGVCSGGPVGSPCDFNDQCASGNCDVNVNECL